MSLNPETITQIQTMLQADPALLAQLQAQTELVGAAAVITKAATAQRLDINEADLLSHLAAEQSQASATTMSDAELEQVAGGNITSAVFTSLMLFGVGCGMMSVFATQIKKFECGKFLTGDHLAETPRI